MLGLCNLFVLGLSRYIWMSMLKFYALAGDNWTAQLGLLYLWEDQATEPFLIIYHQKYKTFKKSAVTFLLLFKMYLYWTAMPHIFKNLSGHICKVKPKAALFNQQGWGFFVLICQMIMLSWVLKLPVPFFFTWQLLLKVALPLGIYPN